MVLNGTNTCLEVRSTQELMHVLYLVIFNLSYLKLPLFSEGRYWKGCSFGLMINNCTAKLQPPRSPWGFFQDPLCKLFQPPSALGVCESAGPMPCLLCAVRVTLRATVVAAIRMQVWRYLGWHQVQAVECNHHFWVLEAQRSFCSAGCTLQLWPSSLPVLGIVLLV